METQGNGLRDGKTERQRDLETVKQGRNRKTERQKDRKIEKHTER